jgi:hypothetical protein
MSEIDLSGTASQFVVTMADGQTHDVRTDQRDWAAMEAREFPRGAIVTAVRYIAYNAMRREGLTRRSWEQFNTTDCVGLEDVTPATDDTDSEDEQGLDPGPSTPNGAAGYNSPSRRANRSKARAASSAGTPAT